MKVSKKLLIYAGAAVYLFAVVMLGYILFQQLGEKETLTTDLATTKTNLELNNPAKLEADKLQYEEELVQVSLETEGLKEMMSLEIDSVPATEIVFDIAASSGVEVLKLSSPSATTDVLENIPCSVTVIDTTVEGTKSHLVEFISALNLALDTGVIQSVDMNIQSGDNASHSTAMILMEVYNYQGE